MECHATGTPVGDAVEFSSLQKLWEEEDAPPAACVIGSVKSNTGHLLTGAGAVGLLKTVLALEHGVLPPTANFTAPDPECDLDVVPNKGRPAEVQAALSHSFAFGGLNAVLAFRKWQG